MVGRLIRYAATLCGVGVSVFLFILFAQANVQDLRELYRFQKPTALSVKLGQFYTLSPGGALNGPVCTVPSEKIAQHSTRTMRNISLTNSFGNNIPLIAEWTKDLVSDVSSELVGLLGPDSDAITFNGHTLVLHSIEHESINSFEDHTAIYEAFLEKPGCEEALEQLYSRGNCVVSIFELVRLSDRVLGVRFYDEDNCYVAQGETDGQPQNLLPLPQMGNSFVAFVSMLKVRSGLIDESRNASASLP